MKSCFFILALICLCSEIRAEISLDLSLLRSWKSTSSYPCRPPFKATYSKNGKILTFLATDHVFGPVSENDARLSGLRTAIEGAKPNGIVIERPVGEGRFVGDNLESEVRRCKNQLDQFTCGEPTYAGIIAARGGAIVVGGEIEPKKNQSELLKKMSRQELLVYYSVLILSSQKEQGLSEADRKSGLVANLRRQIDFEDNEWTYPILESWLSKNLGRKANDVNSSWIEPRNDRAASITQRIAHKFDSVREPQIVAKVADLLKTKDRAMIAYGAGHFVKQAPIYEKAFGRPQIECLAGQYPRNPISPPQRK